MLDIRQETLQESESLGVWLRTHTNTIGWLLGTSELQVNRVSRSSAMMPLLQFLYMIMMMRMMIRIAMIIMWTYGSNSRSRNNITLQDGAKLTPLDSFLIFCVSMASPSSYIHINSGKLYFCSMFEAADIWQRKKLWSSPVRLHACRPRTYIWGEMCDQKIYNYFRRQHFMFICSPSFVTTKHHQHWLVIILPIESLYNYVIAI